MIINRIIEAALLFAWSWINLVAAKRYHLKVHGDTAVCTVDERFLSLALGTYNARQRFKAIDFTSQRLKNVIKALRPAYLRFGGSDANFLVFRPGERLVQPTLITTQTTPTTTPTTQTTPATTRATTTEQQASKEATTTRPMTTETATTTVEPHTTTERSTTTTETPTTSAPVQTQKPQTPLATQQPPVTPPPAVPVTTPPQSQLPNVAIGDNSTPPGGGVPPWGGVGEAKLKNGYNSDKEDSEKDENKEDSKEYLKNGKYYVEDIKQNSYVQNEAPPQYADSYNPYSSAQESSDVQSIAPSAAASQQEAPQANQASESTASYPQDQAAAASPKETAQEDPKQAVEESSPQSPKDESDQGAAAAPQPQPATEAQQQEQPAIEGQQVQTTGGQQVQGAEGQQATEGQQVQATEGQQQPLTETTDPIEAEMVQLHQEDNGNSAKRGSLASNNVQRRRRSTPRGNVDAQKRSRQERFPFWFAAEDFDRLARFADDSGLKLIFDLNGFFRRPDGGWDATNAIDIVRHVKDKGYHIIWELGNEPNRYSSYGQQRVLTATQVAQDTIRLRSLLMQSQRYGTVLIGPAISRPGVSHSERFLKKFLRGAAWAIDAVTWHQYYTSRKANVEELLHPKTLDIFKKQIKKVNKVVAQSQSGKPVWLGESGSAWGGGIPGVSDTYASSFSFLDKLGLAALYCNQVVIRQSLIGGSYALLDDDFTPRPDFWAAFIHKKLVGRKVFTVSGGDHRLRVYAHCTRVRAGYPAGALTLVALNIWKKTTVKIEITGSLGKMIIDKFLVRSSNGKMSSKSVYVNGKEMHLSSGMYVPKLRAVQTKTPLKLPPRSYAFYVIPFANFRRCL